MRRRSVGFLERDGETWSCFLVTFRDRDLRWHGYFSFRPRAGGPDSEEVRTTDIFLEATEEEIDRKARSLGRPLLGGLLASALHTREREGPGSVRLRGWFRQLLSANSRELAGDWDAPTGEAGEDPAGRGPDTEAPSTESAGTDQLHGAEPRSAEARSPGTRRIDEGGAAASNGEPDPERDEALSRIRSLYESYRLDQVAHFISLVEPEDFREAVDRILDGRSFDFGARDRLQFAMMVVDYIEERLPLPPFEVWAEDYLAHPGTYHLYAHMLHRERELP